MKYIIGIDIGTSATKSVLFDLCGNVIASDSTEYPLYQPQNGWAEQDPDDWWNAALKTLKTVSAVAKCGEICGIGLSGQMHGLVMLDENGNVLRNSIIWCDGRTSAECKEIEEIIGHDRLIEITANPALPGFTSSKIMWVKKHEPHIFEKCRHILLPKDYIRYKLTGEFATDVSDASGMQLMDIKNRCWSDEVCAKLGIDMSLLPKLYESPEITGYICKKIAAETGIPAKTPVAGGAGDNAAASVGTGTVENGKAFTTIGTSGVVFAHTDKPLIDKKGRIHTFCCAVPGAWHVMGVTQAAGLSLNWFKNNIVQEFSYKEIDEMCENIPIGCDKLIYLPYLMGERTPVLDSDARGVFFGLSAIHTKAHMARAVIEGVSYSLLDCVNVLTETGVNTENMLICGGGSKSGFWCKMLADVYGTEVKTVQSSEGPALGAAILGGCAGGVFESVADGCRKTVRISNICNPCIKSHGEYLKYYEVYKNLYSSLKDSFKTLSGI